MGKNQENSDKDSNAANIPLMPDDEPAGTGQASARVGPVREAAFVAGGRFHRARVACCEMVLSPGGEVTSRFHSRIRELVDSASRTSLGDIAGVGREFGLRLGERLAQLESERHLEWVDEEDAKLRSLTGQAKQEFDLVRHRELHLRHDHDWLDGMLVELLPRLDPAAQEAFRLGELIETGLLPITPAHSSIDAVTIPDPWPKHLTFGASRPAEQLAPLTLAAAPRQCGDRVWPDWWIEQVNKAWSICVLPAVNLAALVPAGMICPSAPSERCEVITRLNAEAIRLFRTIDVPRIAFSDRIRIVDNDFKSVFFDGQIFDISDYAAFRMLQILCQIDGHQMYGKELKKEAGCVTGNLSQYLSRHLPPELYALVNGVRGGGLFRLQLPPQT